MKKCSKCKKFKPFEQFYFRGTGSLDGLMSSCKECENKGTNEWRKKNPQKWRDYCRKHYYKSKKDGKYYKRASVHPVRRAIYRRKTRYGITEEQFKGFLKKQNNKCAICLKELDQDRKMFCVDHCHKTKIVRGLLCSRCNWGLGSFLDNTDSLKKAIEYINKFNKLLIKAKKLAGANA